MYSPEMQHKQWLKFGTTIAFLSLAIVILYLSMIESTNAFFYRIISTAETTRVSGSLQHPGGQPRKLDFAGYPLIITLLASVTGLTALDVQFVPVGMVLVPIMWAVLISRFTDDCLVIGSFSAVMIFVPSFNTGHFATFAYTWSRVLYLGFVLCLVIFLRQRGSRSSTRELTLLIILSIGLVNIYWSAAGWAALNLFALTALLYFINDRRATIVLYAGIGILVLLITVPTILQELIRIFALQAYSSPLQGMLEFVETISSLIGMNNRSSTGGPDPLPVTTREWAGGLIWRFSRLARHLIVFGTVGVFLLLYLRQLLQHKNQTTWQTTLLTAIVVTAVLHSTVYLARGNLSLRYAGLMFPIVIIILAADLERPLAVRAVGLSLLLISLIAFSGFVAVTGTDKSASYESSAPAGEWIADHSSEPDVLGDFSSVDSMQASTATYDTPVQPSYYNEPRYQWVVSGDGDPPDSTFVAVNLTRFNQSVGTVGWQSFPPFGAYHDDYTQQAIASNSSSTLVYTDGRTVVYRVDN